MRKLIYFVLLSGCTLGPQAQDTPQASANILPPGTMVPSVGTNSELLEQIQLNDGLSAAALAASGGVIARSTGKANGAPVFFWNFGPATLENGGGLTFVVAAPLYKLATDNGDGTFTPLDGVPWLLDSIPGDTRYSAIRRIQYVPVTDKYAGQIIADTDALADAQALGIVGEPVPSGTWIDFPVVTPGVTLQVSMTAPPAASKQVYARDYLVDGFAIGGALGEQPLSKANTPLLGQATSVGTGVATGMPPTLPAGFDPQPVFQYGIPAAPPAPQSPNWTPIVVEVDVRLASGIAPSAITADTDLFTRNAAGAISAYRADNVATFTVTTNVTNRPIQFADGAP
jgi:hypothetical protein